MGIRVSFDEARKIEVDEADMLVPALLLTHVWAMDSWLDRAEIAMELYVRDRYRLGEELIGGEDIAAVHDRFCHLKLEVERLKEHAVDIMNRDPDLVAEIRRVDASYRAMQAFLQPVLWTDQPRSTLEFHAE